MKFGCKTVCLWALLGTGLAQAELTLSAAVSQSLQKNPLLQAQQAELEATRGREQQAGVLPNPELGLLLEDFAGATGRSATAATTTVELSQKLELGGKRSRRQALAATAVQWQSLAVAGQRLQVIRDSRIAFHSLQIAQARRQLAQEAEVLAQQLHEVVQARIAAGKLSPLMARRSDLALRAAQRRTQQAERDRAQAQAALSVLWGGAAVSEKAVALAPVPEQVPLPPEQDAHNPQLAQRELEQERARQQLRVIRAEAVPDITLRVGSKREAVTEEQSLLAGLSFPLPLFDRRQGEQRAAAAALDAARATLAAEELQWQAARARQQQVLLTAHAEARALQDSVLQTAEQDLAASQEAYRAGKLGLSELLDMQRALLDARGAYLDSLSVYFQAQAELDFLLGRDVDFSGDAT